MRILYGVLIGLFILQSLLYWLAPEGYDCMKVYTKNFSNGCLYEFTDDSGTYTHIDECLQDFEKERIGTSYGCLMVRDGHIPYPDIFNSTYCVTSHFWNLF